MTYTDADIARMMGDPPPSRFDDWCEQHGHPGRCFNPWFDLTWCACGKRVTVGDTATHDLCCRPAEPVAAQLSLWAGAA